MEENKILETMINKTNHAEAEEVMNFLKDLDPKQKENFMYFLNGAKFLRNFNLEDKQDHAMK